MYKKRWYDGLNDIYEGKNEFEIKFGCFGGDGGSGGGSKSAEESPPDKAEVLGQVNTAAQQSMASKAEIQDFQNKVAAGLFNSPPAAAPPSAAPPSAAQLASYGPTSSTEQNVSGLSGLSGLSGFNNTTAGVNTSSPTNTQDVTAQATDISNPLGVNIGGFNVAPGMVGNAPGLIGTIEFAQGGAVNQGIGSVFPYPRRR